MMEKYFSWKTFGVSFGLIVFCLIMATDFLFLFPCTWFYWRKKLKRCCSPETTRSCPLTNQCEACSSTVLFNFHLMLFFFFLPQSSPLNLHTGVENKMLVKREVEDRLQCVCVDVMVTPDQIVAQEKHPLVFVFTLKSGNDKHSDIGKAQAPASWIFITSTCGQ